MILAGDVFYANWDEVLPGATAVVSTLGGFGSEEQMQRINGEANVTAVNAAKEYGEDLLSYLCSVFKLQRANYTCRGYSLSEVINLALCFVFYA